MQRALVLVDIQNDFLPTGRLPVPEGDQIISIVNAMMGQFDIVVATQDWHPALHRSFASQHPGKQVGEFVHLNGIEQILWPDHCIQESEGAELVRDLSTNAIQNVFQKGQDVNVDSYSGFFDNDHKTSTGLGDYLKAADVSEVYIAGLALDYCVKYTALDCADLGFKTIVVKNATRAVNMRAIDGDEAIEEMKKNGISVIDSFDLS